MVMMAINHEGWAALLDSVDQKHEEAHARLRQDFRELEGRMESGFKLLSDKAMTNQARISEILTTPIDVTKLVLTPKMVASIVATAMVIVSGIWATQAGLRSDVRDILTRMEAQRGQVEASVRMQEMQADNLRLAINEMRIRQEQQHNEIQSLKEALLKR